MAVVEGLRRCASDAAATFASVISAATAAAAAAALMHPSPTPRAVRCKPSRTTRAISFRAGERTISSRRRGCPSSGARPRCRAAAMPIPRVPPAIASRMPRPQEEFRQNKEKLIEQETKKRMLEEMWQDRVSIAPEEQREIEREQQQQKEAVKALKRENQEQEALLHTKAKELEAVLTSRSEVRRGLWLRQGLQWPRRTAPRPMAVRHHRD